MIDTVVDFVLPLPSVAVAVIVYVPVAPTVAVHVFALVPALVSFATCTPELFLITQVLFAGYVMAIVAEKYAIISV